MPGNANFDSIASTTLQNYRPVLQDNIFKRVPLLMWLEKKGRMMLDGGRTIVIPLTYTKNSTAQGYTGYGVLNTTPQEEQTAAEYVWAQYAASISISGREEAQNAESKTRIVNLLKAKMEGAEKSLREKINEDAFGSTLDSENKVNGLQSLVDTTSTVGDISRSTDAWWQAKVTTSVGSFASGGVNAMRTLYLNASNAGSNTPDFAITTQSVFEYYEKSLQTQQRFNDSKAADGSFETLKFKNVTLFFDPFCPSGELYFLNSDALAFVTHSDRNFITTDFKKPVNQDAKVAQVFWMGNLAVEESRRLGKLTGITS